jgi:xylulokinase
LRGVWTGMKILALDIGSSSVRAGVLDNGRLSGRVAKKVFDTHFDGVRAEVKAQAVLKALADAIAELGARAKRVETIAMATMAPSWVAMDKTGRALTPIVTHQDRRSVEIARELERRVGRERHLRLAGNRPFPGGISSTTWAWHLRHAPEVMKKADLCGHLSTFLHRQLTAARVTDPSNASFSGFYSTLDQSGWREELCDAVGIKWHRLPQVIGSDGVAGLVTRPGARRFGLVHGTPVLAGCMDGSAAMLLAGNAPGQLVNAAGSTDVLALCTDRPRPHERLLTRAVGVGQRWVSVSTLAAAGTALEWLHRTLFSEMKVEAFRRLVLRLSGKPDRGSAVFENYLAGDRMSIDQRQASFTGLSLSTTREQMLSAVIESLAEASAERMRLLQEANPIRIRREVVVTGGMTQGLEKVLYRGWRGQWRFRAEDDATLRGLGALV